MLVPSVLRICTLLAGFVNLCQSSGLSRSAAGVLVCSPKIWFIALCHNQDDINVA